MKPELIEMQAFGPFMEVTACDMRALWDASLFLITGPTGSGKTTVLDAMSFALYGYATGGLRGFSDMRNVSADPELDTFVRFTFCLGEEKYRFYRCLHLHRKRDGTLTEQQTAEAWHLQGEQWQLLATGGEAVRKTACELTGFTHSQFSQVIVLPQGEFRRLLLANTREKAEILQTLFRTDIWQRAVEHLQRKRTAARQALEGLTTKLDTLYSSIGVEDMEQTAALARQTELQVIQAQAALQKAEKDRLQAETHLEQAALRADQLTRLQQQRLALMALQQQGPVMEQRLADCEALGRLADVLPLVADCDRYQEQICQLTKTLEQTQQGLQALQQQQTQLAHRIKNGTEKIRALAEEKIHPLMGWTNQKQALAKVLEAKAAADALEQTLAKLRGDLPRAQQDLALAQAAAEQLEAARQADLAAHLAEHLHSGQPCPVCGALEHPAPAQKSTGPEGDPQAAQQALVKARESVLKIQTMLEVKQEEFTTVQSACRDYSPSTRTEYDAVCEMIRQGQAAQKTQKEYIALLEELQQQQQELKNREQKLLAEQMSAKAALAENTARLSAAEAQLAGMGGAKQVADGVAQLCAGLEITHTDANAILQAVGDQKAQVEAYFRQCELAQQRLTEQLQALEYTAMPTVEHLDHAAAVAAQARQAAEEALAEQKQRCTAAGEQVGTCKQKAAQIQRVLDAVTALCGQYADLEKEYSVLEQVTELATGKNQAKTTLHHFVMGLMLDEVTAAASRYLHIFSRGRYALVRADLTGGNTQRGLDISVLDAHIGTTRVIGTLSGGELFLASLSLAFGLAETVSEHASGIPLDSIFIDEGFGSLDTETLEAAMKALAQIRQSGRLVGIISHVTELKNRIPAQVEIQPAKNGSTLTIKV